MRKSLYLKDDDYRLSFLYGNFTTLTRFTEADLERVVTERISPLHVCIHATDPEVRADLLRNRRGATSLRWLRALLDHGIEVHGQIVVCPGRNDGAVLDDTLAGVLDRFPELASLCVVPLGVSRYNTEAAMRPHTRRPRPPPWSTPSHDWQDVFLATLGHRLVFAADEYYLLAERALPGARGLRGLPDARGRRRHGPHVRARVHRRGGPAHRRGHRASSPGSTAPRPRATGRPAPPTPPAGACGVRTSAPAVPPPSRSRPGATRPSASSPGPTAPPCSAPSSPASAATTCA